MTTNVATDWDKCGVCGVLCPPRCPGPNFICSPCLSTEKGWKWACAWVEDYKRRYGKKREEKKW